MDLWSRVSQVIKEDEAALVWDCQGFRLIAPSYDDTNLPEEIVALMLFVDRFCADEDFAEQFLDVSEENDEEAE